MKKQAVLFTTCVLIFTLILSGCGAKSKQDVVDDLGKTVDNLKSYETDATMTFQHGDSRKTYDVRISFQKPDNYRVALTDGKHENRQMIIKNEEGVFVISPELNKKYRFVSDWPNNRSQAYLYHSLAKDILNDPDPGFESKEKQYVFETKTNYNTSELASQRISLKKDLTPEAVDIMNKDQQVMVNVTFKNFKMNPNIDKKTFDVDQNMMSAKLSESEQTSADVQETEFQLNYPSATIDGTKLSEMKPETSQSGEKYVLKYKGEKPFTLIESKSAQATGDVAVLASGDPANLGFTVGSQNGRTLSWSHEGTDYFLASEKLTLEEMITIAQSVDKPVTK